MFEEQIKQLELRLEYAWPHTPINLDSVPYVPTLGKAWIRFQASWITTEFISGEPNNGLYREHGIAIIGVFTPRNTGAGPNFVFCDEVQQIYRNWQHGHLKCGVTRVDQINNEKEWFYSNVLIPFYYDHNFKRAA